MPRNDPIDLQPPMKYKTWRAARSLTAGEIKAAETGERSLDLLRWGQIPYWCIDPTGGRKPINAKSETVVRLPTFREAYRSNDLSAETAA
jgi:putative SOS response-associated peptidase YedK